MDQFTKEDAENARKMVNFYVDLLENNSTTIPYYLADNVVLDWFGKSIKERKKVCSFMKEDVCKVTHLISNSFPATGVAFKESHKVKINNKASLICSPCSSGPFSPVGASTSSEMGQGDGLHNCEALSPAKKMKITPKEDDTELETLEDEMVEDSCKQLKYVTAEGAVEFRKPSYKKFQSEVKWKRPVKLHIGYTASSFKDCTIYLVIYEGNLKCRRNLLKEFSDSSDKSPV